MNNLTRTPLAVEMVARTQHLKFVWSGGEYIEVFSHNQTNAHDVINVWDYAECEPRYEVSLDGFVKAIHEWLADDTDHNDIR
jgi:hypothetical protein